MSSNNVDILSMLPEEILSHILSLMPTKFAVRTCVLSKIWRYSWMLVTNVDLRDSHFHDIYALSSCCIRIMELCTTSKLNFFRLGIHRAYHSEPWISDMIEKAVRLNVLELDLHVNKKDLPLSLFTCHTLTKLRLDHTLHNSNVVYGCKVNLPSLRTLDIVGFTDSFINASNFISGCPMLESLSLKIIHSKKGGEEYIFNIPTLKRLKVTWPRYAWPRSEIYPVNNKVVLCTPNLEYLYVDGLLLSSFVMKDVSSLIEASLTIFTIDVNEHLWYELLKGLSGVKSLSIQKIYSLVKNPSTLILPCFPNTKHLELKGYWNSGEIPQFLESFLGLKHLYIEEIADLWRAGSNWIEPKLIPFCMLTNLTTIMFSKCIGRYTEEQILKYMIGNAKVLKTVKVTWKYNQGSKSRIEEEERQWCANLIKVHRASSYCEIHFLERHSLS